MASQSLGHNRESVGINRNIVECKSFSPRCGRVMVHCINRNIVECKFRRVMHLRHSPFHVLIETLWNVNLALKMTWDIKSVVLIETLWNVNSNPAIALTVHPWY